MATYFCKTTELNGSSFVKFPLRFSAILHDDNYCLLWPTIASVHLCESSHPKGISNYRQLFNELNIVGFD